MSTPFQRQVEVRIIQHLYVRLHFGGSPLTEDAMYARFCKGTNISRIRFDDAFSSLKNLGYFIESGGFEGAMQWRLSPFGVGWVEDYYTFTRDDPQKQALTFYPRHEGTIMIGTRRQAYLNQLAAEETGNKVAIDIESSVRWTRSGALAAWLALPIAIIGIIITVILAS